MLMTIITRFGSSYIFSSGSCQFPSSLSLSDLKIWTHLNIIYFWFGFGRFLSVSGWLGFKYFVPINTPKIGYKWVRFSVLIQNSSKLSCKPSYLYKILKITKTKLLIIETRNLKYHII